MVWTYFDSGEKISSVDIFYTDGELNELWEKRYKMIHQFKPIGVVRCQLKELEDVPFHWKVSEVEGRIEIFKEFKNGLKGIGRFSHIAVIFIFHKSRGYRLVQIARDGDIRGVFATGSPLRPNPVGLSILKLLKVEDNILYVKWLDMVDGTPVLDIKPFHFDEIKKKFS